MKQQNNRSSRSANSPGNKGRITRRDLIKGAVGLGAMAAFPVCAQVGKDAAGVTRKSISAKSDLVRPENARPGTRDWLLTNTRIDPKTKYRCPWIEGYCSRTSGRSGEEIAFHVSTNPSSPFTLDIYRMGYYGGTGGRHMLTLGSFPVAPQTMPMMTVERLRECAW